MSDIGGYVEPVGPLKARLSAGEVVMPAKWAKAKKLLIALDEQSTKETADGDE